MILILVHLCILCQIFIGKRWGKIKLSLLRLSLSCSPRFENWVSINFQVTLILPLRYLSFLSFFHSCHHFLSTNLYHLLHGKPHNWCSYWQLSPFSPFCTYCQINPLKYLTTLLLKYLMSLLYSLLNTLFKSPWHVKHFTYGMPYPHPIGFSLISFICTCFYLKGCSQSRKMLCSDSIVPS